MAKSDKTTIRTRVHEVVRLLLAGAEFAEIRQYASSQGWQVSDRQLRRYQERAYRRLAKATTRQLDQLLGRHLMQRRALYARALKNNDLKTALQVLRDEASLQGLYPATKIAPTTPDGKEPYVPVVDFSVREELLREPQYLEYLRLLAMQETILPAGDTRYATVDEAEVRRDAPVGSPTNPIRLAGPST